MYINGGNGLESSLYFLTCAEMLFFYCDFEGFSCGANEFIVKEISILSNDGMQCFTYRVGSPNNCTYFPRDSTFKYQYDRHHLAWEDGDYCFSDAMGDIRQKVLGSVMYVKGEQKQRFLEKYFPYVSQLDMLPSFSKLNSCPTEWCEYRHGKNCARRKVHELKYFVDNNKVLLH